MLYGKGTALEPTHFGTCRRFLKYRVGWSWEIGIVGAATGLIYSIVPTQNVFRVHMCIPEGNFRTSLSEDGGFETFGQAIGASPSIRIP